MQDQEPSLAAGVIDLLRADPRPSFIVELHSYPNTAAIVFSNGPLCTDAALFQSIVESSRDDSSDFWKWVTTSSQQSPSHLHHNVSWTRSVLQKKWVVVGANIQASQALTPPPPPPLLTSRQGSDYAFSGTIIPGARNPPEPTETLRLEQNGGLVRLASPEPVVGDVAGVGAVAAASTVAQADSADAIRGRSQSQAVDQGWIVPAFTHDHQPFLDVINGVDWASTPLGARQNWPQRLQQIFGQILLDSRPMAVYWGSEHQTTVYNEAFSALCGRLHPSALGKPVAEVWPSKSEHLQAAIRQSAQTQRAVTPDDEWSFFVENADGTLRETYSKWSVIPVTENGVCLGFMHSIVDTTDMRLWERRMKMLIDLGETLVTAKGVKSYWRKTIENLAAVEPRYDVPLAILYSVHEDLDTKESPALYDSNQICILEGSLGVPVGHPLAPATLGLRSSNNGMSVAFRKALKELVPVPVRTSDGSLPPSFLEGVSWRGFGDPCKEALVCPIRPTREEKVMGILVLGLNPRRPYDNGYRQYVSLLNQKLMTTLASTVLLEEETTEFVRRFETVSQFIPMGMCFSDNKGNITFANEAWSRITGVDAPASGPISTEDFFSSVVEEDIQNIRAAQTQLRSGHDAVFEFRIKRQADKAHSHRSRPPQPDTTSPAFEKTGLDLAGIDDGVTERHVHALAKPERAPDGTVIRTLTCLTDVTLHRRTADEAVRRAQQAENLKRMAELATVGMYDMNLEGRLLGANKVFFEMCGVRKVDLASEVVTPFKDSVVPEDMHILEDAISRLVAEGKPQTAEMRFKKPWTVEDGAVKVVAPRWVLATFMPVRSSDNVIRSFTGCLSDESLQKWQLEVERQRKEDAIESKRQQESFIDMTSHEMRNPLSAIIHCADAIVSSLGRLAALEPDETRTSPLVEPPPPSATPPNYASEGGHSRNLSSNTAYLGHPTVSAAQTPDFRSLAANAVDNAEIIVSCAQHQKRIVDDILTMSKLDSNLLAVTPVAADPVLIVEQAVKMFEVEARRTDIKLDINIDPSYERVGVRRFEFDPSRVKQVLINLLTNALKFTGAGPTRRVEVTISASSTRPTDETSDVQFISPSAESREYDAVKSAATGADATSSADAAFVTDTASEEKERRHQSGGLRGDPVYLLFKVKDTGQGLSDVEKKSLFQRFVQASSRTHVIYGGSGLGLFISRRLTEMQNGAIGVASSPGLGSTFAFYIEAYRLPVTTVPSARSRSRGVLAIASAGEDEEDEDGGGAALSSPSSSLPVAAAAAAAATAMTLPLPLVGATILNAPLLSPSMPFVSVPFPVSAVAAAAAVGVAAPVNVPGASASRVWSGTEEGGSETYIKGILVVEDNIINQTITRRGLVDRGYTVDVANHGLEALDKLKSSDRFIADGEEAEDKAVGSSERFQLSIILMDMEMPVQDGLTCTREIRELERRGRIRGGRIPIIAVSANARIEQITQAKNAGCDDVLVKPYRMPELIQKMRLVVDRLDATATPPSPERLQEQQSRRQPADDDVGPKQPASSPTQA